MTAPLQVAVEPTARGFRRILRIENASRIFLVCGKSFLKQRLYRDVIDRMGLTVTIFTDFEPNPRYESVVRGIKAYRESNSDFIIAAGGGSAMDVAKCIRFYCGCDTDVYLLNQHPDGRGGACLFAIPTTAGTGSESTRFAAIYVDGIKHSVSDDSNLPKYICMAPELLDTLPLEQRKVTLLDALCHCIESFWSVNSTDDSKSYSRKSMKTILENYQGYLINNRDANALMLEAANMAGKAIDIAKTTACHAMSYILTAKYNTPHGFAASLFIPNVWRFINDHIDRCSDTRGDAYLVSAMAELSNIITLERFTALLGSLDLPKPELKDDTPHELALRVNEARLKNTPVRMYQEDIEKIYADVLR